LLLNRSTGPVLHNLVIGAEVGAQSTSNYRNTGYFAQNATTTKVDIANPAYHGEVTFKQSATDANSESDVKTRSVYVQDQLVFSPRLRLIAGARYESFDVRFKDKRTDAKRDRTDDMISPRVGLVVKPHELASIYANYSVSYLPGSGDQFTSLTDITKALKPERFNNYEVGAKWDAFDRLSLTLATYRLDRENTRATHPTDPALVVQTGAQRSEGVELSAAGNVTPAWQIAAGAAAQRAKIISATTASPAGAKVPLVPSRSMSLWNKYSISPRLGIAAGMIHQSKVFAAIDNAVTLPAFTRFDGALYVGVTSAIRAQLNVENLFDVRYYPTSNGNHNIAPGSPRDVRLSLSAVF
jgi:catecholate siderophore receptor